MKGGVVVQRQSVTGPVSATFESSVKTSPQGETSHFSDGAIFYGTLTFVGGCLTVLTIAFAQIGLLVAMLGATMVGVGLAGKLTSSLWRKLKRAKPPMPDRDKG